MVVGRWAPSCMRCAVASPNDTPESEALQRRRSLGVPNSATMPLPQRSMPAVLEASFTRTHDVTYLRIRATTPPWPDSCGDPGQATPPRRAEPDPPGRREQTCPQGQCRPYRSGLVLLPSRTQVMPRGGNQ